MRKTSFDLSDTLHRQVNLASASLGLSSGEYIRAAIRAALEAHAALDPIVKMALETDTRIRESVTA